MSYATWKKILCSHLHFMAKNITETSYRIATHNACNPA